jgi:hypothetical protein
MTLSFPNDCIQSIAGGEWWIKDDSSSLCLGRLVKAAIPHIDQIPKMFTPRGRKAPTIHDAATFQVEPFNIKNYGKHSKLPVAGLPAYPREVNIVQRAKRRPSVILGLGGPTIPKKDNPGKPSWQTSPTLLVAPYYGVDEGTERSGWAEAFVDRIRSCESSQMFWDILPLSGADSSILRLDQLQAIGRHHNSLEVTQWRLSETAMELMNEWLDWVRFDGIAEDSLLETAVGELNSIKA